MPASRLFAHDLGDGIGQAFLIGLFVVRLAALPGAQELLQRLRADQAADMGGENAVAAAFHARSMPARATEGNVWAMAQ